MKGSKPPALSLPPTAAGRPPTYTRRRNFLILGLLIFAITQSFVLLFPSYPLTTRVHSAHTLAERGSLSERCKDLHTPAGPPASFNPSSRIAKGGSDRYVPGTPPVLLRNAKIWTGARNGTEVVFGDVLLDKGLVVAVGYIPHLLMEKAMRNGEVKVVDVGGKWVTPGLVDLHSHIGVYSSPALSGASDGNSRKAPILPWLRSIDGLNTHDESYLLAMSGGVTTAQILPGSANNIGGQAFVIKLRPTADRSVTSKVIEPPAGLYSTPNGTDFIHWRHMKHACGENPDRLYGQTRMDGIWNFRNAYNEARKVMESQDSFCRFVERKEWSEVDGKTFPESYEWECLVDVLRGKVKLAVHCYEAVDLDGIVRLTNEFKFPVASFHHAGETYLVPDLLKKAWGGAPSIALFASNFRKKREAYRGSEFAPRILADNGIPVVMKSDHPVINSRYLMFEAQQAHYYGLNPALALASVTSTPARAAGLGHRVGTIAEGFDADLVIWDSHPLNLGATPTQVYVDGIPQLSNPQTLEKPPVFQDLPKTPNFDKDAKDAVEYDGLPPLTTHRKIHITEEAISNEQVVKFTNVKSVYTRNDDAGSRSVEVLWPPIVQKDEASELVDVVVVDGEIKCGIPNMQSCAVMNYGEVIVVDLQGGSLAPGLTTYGSPLGLVEIRLESSTNDGNVWDPLTDGDLPDVLGNETVVRAVDGLSFEGRNALLAYRSGVTQAITAPTGGGFLRGLSTAFSVGAAHAIERGAIAQEEVALHVSLDMSMRPSVSTQIAALRGMLFSSGAGPWQRVRTGEIPLVINVENADIMATLLALKSEYEETSGETLRLTFSGAAEAHLLAEEIGKAGVSVVLTSVRPYPGVWQSRRILPGPPLSNDSAITSLLAKNVNVGIGVADEAEARNTRFEIAWAALLSNGSIGKATAIALATSNLERALGVKKGFMAIPDLVAYQGGDIFELESKVVGVVSARRRVVEFF